MTQKYSSLLSPIMKALRSLLRNWYTAKDGKQVREYTEIFIRFISNMSKAEGIIKDSISELSSCKNK